MSKWKKKPTRRCMICGKKVMTDTGLACDECKRKIRRVI